MEMGGVQLSLDHAAQHNGVVVEATTILPWPSSSVAASAACAVAHIELLDCSVSLAGWKFVTVSRPNQ